MRPALLALLLLVVPGCAAETTFKRAEGYDPRVPLRVAVLPFVDRASGDQLVSRPFTALLDLVPILSDDTLTKKNAATLLRLKLAANLHRTQLDVVDLFVVDSLLGHRKLDALRAYDADRAEAARRLGEALGADAVLFGEVVEWDREYYVVESVVRAGLKVELRETTSGALLFESRVREEEYAGLSKVPLAYDVPGAIKSAVLEPLRGLRNTLFYTLSDDVAREVVTGLVPSAEERAAAKAPRIRFVAHTDAEALAPGDELVVVAIGDPGARATFRVGETETLPMTESAPGSYRGTLRISPVHALADETLTVRFVSKELRASTMTLDRPRLATRRAP